MGFSRKYSLGIRERVKSKKFALFSIIPDFFFSAAVMYKLKQLMQRKGISDIFEITSE